MAEKYLIVMTTVLVATQVIRITQNFVQLSRQNKAIKRELERVGEITDEDIATQKRFSKLLVSILTERRNKMSRDNTCIFCNESIPEGRMVCPVCEEALRNVPAGKYTKKSFIATLKKEAKKLFRIA